MYNIFFQKAIFPAVERIYGTNILTHYNSLLESQWCPTEKIQRIQASKLKLLIRYAYENVPYYHSVFRNLNLHPDDIRSKDDLVKLPILTKDMIRRNFSQLLSRDYQNIPSYEYYSSGSTGEPFRYYLDKSSYSAGWAQTFRCWNWAGFTLGKKYVKISMNKRINFRQNIQDFLLRTRFIYGLDFSEDSVNRIIKQIQEYKPSIIRGYASHLYNIAKLMENNNLTLDGMAVTTTGDILFPHYRELIEDRFCCKIFDCYGGEGAAIAFECEMHNGYHIGEEDVIMELVNFDDTVIEEGTGRVIFTNLNNYSLPFIRYDIGDIAQTTNKRCACGRNLSRLLSIEGRDSDMIYSSSGRFLPVQYFTVLFKRIGGVDQFQIIQEDYSHLLIKIVKNASYTSQDTQHIINSIQQAIGYPINISMKFVTEIPVFGRSGKRRFVISKISPKKQE